MQNSVRTSLSPEKRYKESLLGAQDAGRGNLTARNPGLWSGGPIPSSVGDLFNRYGMNPGRYSKEVSSSLEGSGNNEIRSGGRSILHEKRKFESPYRTFSNTSSISPSARYQTDATFLKTPPNTSPQIAKATSKPFQYANPDSSPKPSSYESGSLTTRGVSSRNSPPPTNLLRVKDTGFLTTRGTPVRHSVPPSNMREISRASWRDGLNSNYDRTSATDDTDRTSRSPKDRRFSPEYTPILAGGNRTLSPDPRVSHLSKLTSPSPDRGVRRRSFQEIENDLKKIRQSIATTAPSGTNSVGTFSTLRVGNENASASTSQPAGLHVPMATSLPTNGIGSASIENYLINTRPFIAPRGSFLSGDVSIATDFNDLSGPEMSSSFLRSDSASASLHPKSNDPRSSPELNPRYSPSSSYNGRDREFSNNSSDVYTPYLLHLKLGSMSPADNPVHDPVLLTNQGNHNLFNMKVTKGDSSESMSLPVLHTTGPNNMNPMSPEGSSTSRKRPLSPPPDPRQGLLQDPVDALSVTVPLNEESLFVHQQLPQIYSPATRSADPITQLHSPELGSSVDLTGRMGQQMNYLSPYQMTSNDDYGVSDVSLGLKSLQLAEERLAQQVAKKDALKEKFLNVELLEKNLMNMHSQAAKDVQHSDLLRRQLDNQKKELDRAHQKMESLQNDYDHQQKMMEFDKSEVQKWKNENASLHNRLTLITKENIESNQLHTEQRKEMMIKSQQLSERALEIMKERDELHDKLHKMEMELHTVSYTDGEKMDTATGERADLNNALEQVSQLQQQLSDAHDTLEVEKQHFSEELQAERESNQHVLQVQVNEHQDALQLQLNQHQEAIQVHHEAYQLLHQLHENAIKSHEEEIKQFEEKLQLEKDKYQKSAETHQLALKLSNDKYHKSLQTHEETLKLQQDSHKKVTQSHEETLLKNQELLQEDHKNTLTLHHEFHQGELKQIKDKYQNTITNLRDRLREMERRYQVLEAHNAGRLDSAEVASRSDGDSALTKTDLQVEYNALVTEKTNLLCVVQNMEEEIKAVRKETEDKEAALQLRVLELEERENALSHSRTNQTDITSLQTDITQIPHPTLENTTIVELEDALLKMEDARNNYQKQCEDLKSALVKIEDDKDKILAEYENMKTRIQYLESIEEISDQSLEFGKLTQEKLLKSKLMQTQSQMDHMKKAHEQEIKLMKHKLQFFESAMVRPTVEMKKKEFEENQPEQLQFFSEQLASIENLRAIVGEESKIDLKEKNYTAQIMAASNTEAKLRKELSESEDNLLKARNDILDLQHQATQITLEHNRAFMNEKQSNALQDQKYKQDLRQLESEHEQVKMELYKSKEDSEATTSSQAQSLKLMETTLAEYKKTADEEFQTQIKQKLQKKEQILKEEFQNNNSKLEEVNIRMEKQIDEMQTRWKSERDNLIYEIRQLEEERQDALDRLTDVAESAKSTYAQEQNIFRLQEDHARMIERYEKDRKYDSEQRDQLLKELEESQQETVDALRFARDAVVERDQDTEAARDAMKLAMERQSKLKEELEAERTEWDTEKRTLEWRLERNKEKENYQNDAAPFPCVSEIKSRPSANNPKVSTPDTLPDEDKIAISELMEKENLWKEAEEKYLQEIESLCTEVEDIKDCLYKSEVEKMELQKEQEKSKEDVIKPFPPPLPMPDPRIKKLEEELQDERESRRAFEEDEKWKMQEKEEQFEAIKQSLECQIEKMINDVTKLKRRKDELEKEKIEREARPPKKSIMNMLSGNKSRDS